MGLPGNPEKFHKTFNEARQTLCPGAINIHFARIDTKDSHPHHSIYDADRTYFRTTQRHAFIRQAHCGEFDYSPSSAISTETYPTLEFQTVLMPNDVLRSIKKFIPKLWILVTDLGEGCHQVTAIYRGDAMWQVEDREGVDTAYFKTTDDLSKALAKVQQCEGIDKKAWERFIPKLWDACVLDAAIIETKGKAIH